MTQTTTVRLADTAIRETTPPAPASAAPAPRVAQFDPAVLASLSHEQRQQFAQRLTAAGHDPGAVAAALSTGPEVVDRREGEAHSAREQAALEAALDGVPAANVDLRGLWVGRSEDTATAAGLDLGLRQALSSMQIPQAMTRGFAQELLKAGDEWGALRTPADRAWYEQNQKATVERITGKPYAEVLSKAAAITSKIPQDVAKVLASRGYFNRASTIVNLYRQAERMTARGR